jgi:hypothetical protein
MTIEADASPAGLVAVMEKVYAPFDKAGRSARAVDVYGRGDSTMLATSEASKSGKLQRTDENESVVAVNTSRSDGFTFPGTASIRTTGGWPGLTVTLVDAVADRW